MLKEGAREKSDKRKIARMNRRCRINCMGGGSEIYPRLRSLSRLPHQPSPPRASLLDKVCLLCFWQISVRRKPSGTRSDRSENFEIFPVLCYAWIKILLHCSPLLEEEESDVLHESDALSKVTSDTIAKNVRRGGNFESISENIVAVAHTFYV